MAGIQTNTIIANRYQVLEKVGQGGMAEVYKVWDRVRNSHLAMKALRPEFARNRVLLDTFQREAQTLSQLQHPNIIRYYEFVRDEDSTLLFMGYVEGESLWSEIQKDQRGGLNFRRILEIMDPVCRALNYAHAQGYVHCDIKPSNIMIDTRGQVLVADLGIARFSGGDRSRIAGFGTPTHMAPEQIQGRTPNPQTDIYALGIVLYEMVTGGKVPFDGKKASITGGTSEKICWEHLHLELPSPGDMHPRIPPDLVKIINTCLEKDPSQRYRNTLELLNALTLIVSAESGARLEIAPQDNRGMAVWKIQFNLWERVKPTYIWLAAGTLLVIGIIFLARNFLVAPQEPGIQLPTLPTRTTTPQISFDTNECIVIPLTGSNRLSECVTRVTVFSDGSMRFDFSWTADIEDGLVVTKGSDRDNRNIYLTDDSGFRYDHLGTGGDASRSVDIRDGETAAGWFLFPVAQPSASYFIFHDDDNHVQTAPIYREWP
jgi:serine/threonine protein kinase